MGQTGRSASQTGGPFSRETSQHLEVLWVSGGVGLVGVWLLFMKQRPPFAGVSATAGAGALPVRATYLQLVFLHRDFTVYSVPLVTTHFLQLLSVEGEELSSGEDAKVFHCPGTQSETQSEEMITVARVASC